MFKLNVFFIFLTTLSSSFSFLYTSDFEFGASWLQVRNKDYTFVFDSTKLCHEDQSKLLVLDEPCTNFARLNIFLNKYTHSVDASQALLQKSNALYHHLNSYADIIVQGKSDSLEAAKIKMRILVEENELKRMLIAKIAKAKDEKDLPSQSIYKYCWSFMPKNIL